jgi:hypothetical protein
MQKQICVYIHQLLPFIWIQLQGCQMAYFQTKNSNFGNFWKVLKWKMLGYFMTIWSFIRLLGIFMAIYYILRSFGIYFSSFGLLYILRKSGNPVQLICIKRRCNIWNMLINFILTFHLARPN